MSPTQFHSTKKEISQMTNNSNINNALCPPPLKINKDSHFIKKSSSSSPSSSSSSTSSLINGVTGPIKPSQRHPVIIYTHSPKVIHTHPRDFMALVQKLTGLSRSQDGPTSSSKPEPSNDKDKMKSNTIGGGDDNESSSVVTDENCCSLGNNGQVNSRLVQPIFEPVNNPYMNNIPLFTPNSTEFLCTNPMYYNYPDSLFFNTSNTRSSASSAPMEGMNNFHFPEY